MGSAHTPGAWTVSGGQKHPVGETFGVKGARGWIAKVHPLNGTDDAAEAEANAELIARAPLLLAAVKALMPFAVSRAEDLVAYSPESDGANKACAVVESAETLLKELGEDWP
jgi:hypothetical protein